MLRIGDGYFPDGRIAQSRKPVADIHARITSYPQHNFSDCVQISAARRRKPFGLEFSRILDVRGEKDVKWRAVFDLRKEISGGSGGHSNRAACGLLEIRDDFIDRVGQIRSGGYRDRAAGFLYGLRRENES